MGNRVFICDNLSFSGDVTVARKHTRFIGRDLDRLIYAAVGRLADMRVKQEVRFAAYRNGQLTDPEAHDLIIRAMLARIVSGAQVAQVVDEWQKPAHEEFAPRNVWSLFNDFTEVLKGTAPLQLIHEILAPSVQNVGTKCPKSWLLVSKRLAARVQNVGCLCPKCWLLVSKMLAD